MKLSTFHHKKIKITTTDEEVFSGYVINYLPADENEPERESIVVECQNGIFEFYEDELKHVEIL